MKLRLSIRKTIEAQAANHFETAKKAKRKLLGTKATIARFEKEAPKAVELANRATIKAESEAREKAWYEKFRWSKTTGGALIVGGRDASTNEIIMKKYVTNQDLVFHTEEPGSPFVLLRSAKGEPDTLSQEDKEETAQFTACYGRAWKRGTASAQVFWVLPEQVSKTASAGESIGKGSFMVRGTKNFIDTALTLALGIIEGVPTVGNALLFQNAKVPFAEIVPGENKASDNAKRIATKIGGTSDQWVSLLPPGGAKIVRWHKVNKSTE